MAAMPRMTDQTSSLTIRASIKCAAQFACFAWLLQGAATYAQSTAQADAAVIALEQQNCEAATDALNKGMANNEPKSFFIAGQLFEHGICLKTDPARSASVYERAALLGDAASARSLALLHARGAGVPQSYKEAGRWYAVMRGEKKGAETLNAESYATADAMAKTYVQAVHDLAEQRMAYPREATAAKVTGKVRVRFDPRTGAANVISSSDNTGQSMTHVGPNKRLFERSLLAGYDDAVKTLPKPSIPDTADYSTEHEAKFERVPGGASGSYDYQLRR